MPSTGDPCPERAEQDCAPDPEPTVPDLECGDGALTVLAPVELRVCRQVVDPRADQPERHRPGRDVSNGTGSPAAGAEPAVGDHDGDDDAEDDAERVRTDRHRGEVYD